MARRLLGAAFGAVVIALTSCGKRPEAPPPASSASSAFKVATTADTTVLKVNLGSTAPAPCASSPLPPCLAPSNLKDEAGAKTVVVLLDSSSAPDGLAAKALAQIIDGSVERLVVATSQSDEHLISILKLLVSKWGEPHESKLPSEHASYFRGRPSANPEPFMSRVWNFSNLRVVYEPVPYTDRRDGPAYGTITFETPRWQKASAVSPEKRASSPSRGF